MSIVIITNLPSRLKREKMITYEKISTCICCVLVRQHSISWKIIHWLNEIGGRWSSFKIEEFLSISILSFLNFYYNPQASSHYPPKGFISISCTGLADSDQDLCLHKPYSIARGPGEVACQSVWEASPQASADHLWDQCSLPEGKPFTVKLVMFKFNFKYPRWVSVYLWKLKIF